MNDSTELSLIDCNIKSLKDVPLRLNLTSINLHSNKLIKIECLTYLQNLLHLDLSSNQLKQISGIEGLVSLQTLNLACNNIESIDGLHGLKKIKWLNLSFNKIQFLNGLNEISGRDYALETLLLNGNQINSIEECKAHLSLLNKLKHLSLNDNPIARIKNYRNVILLLFKQLISLDTISRSNTRVSVDANYLPGLEQYEEFLHTDSNQSEDFNKLFNNSNRMQLKQLFERDLLANNQDSSNSFDHSDSSFNGDNEDDPNTTQDKEEKLNKLNEQIQKYEKMKEFLLQQEKLKQNQATKETTNNKSSSQLTRKKQQPNPNTKKSDATSQTIQAYETLEEKDARIRLENELKQANKAIDDYKSQIIMYESEREKFKIEEKYEDLFKKEKKKSDELQLKATNYQKMINELKNQMESYKRAHESNMKTLSTLEEKLSQSNADKKEYEDKYRGCDSASNQLRYEVDCLKQKNNSIQMQLQQLQETLSNSELKHKKELEGLVSLNGAEVKQLIRIEVDKYQQIHDIDLKQFKEKNESLVKEYKALEDEFRMALIIEANRFTDVHALYERASSEASESKKKLQVSLDREERSRTVIGELNALVKEQKVRLQELSKVREEALTNIKKQNLKLEELIDENKKLKTQNETLKKDKKDCENRLVALDSLLEGLRKEKQLWSHELAQQGSHLAQDRGRMEAQLLTFQSEISTLKKQLERETDTVRIKTKVIEDQVETIRKLKDGLNEKDDIIRKRQEETLKTHKSLEQKLIEEQALYHELEDKYNKVLERKDELKEQVFKLRSDYDQIKNEYEQKTKIWKEKSLAISELETRVRGIKDDYDVKEKKLVEENKQLSQRVRQLDDDFRKQFDSIQKSHEQQLIKLKHDCESRVTTAEFKVAETEEEMRIILAERNQMEEKIKKVLNFW